MLIRKDIQIWEDEKLVSHYQAEGDPACVGELFRRYTHLLFLTCMKYLKNEAESEDAVMSIFEKLLVDLKRYEVKRFRYWLHTVTRNHCLMLLDKRKQSFKRQAEFQESQGQQDGMYSLALIPEEILTRESHILHLEHAIEKLVKEQKECITLFYLQKKKYQEVSELTGYSLKQVKSYIQNGKRNLKKHLATMKIQE
ncbi:MAG: sigma-70 family RNA polymerase sigma factor [Bacteroidota bacterium]